MEWPLLEKCLHDIKEFKQPLFEIVPSNYGETFVSPNWFDSLELISDSLPRTQIVLPTNGTFLTNDTVNKLCMIPTLKLVNVSVNAVLPETYRAFHFIDPRAMDVIKSGILKLRASRPDIIVWASCAFDPSYQSPREMEMFHEEWNKYGTVQVNPCQYNNRPERVPRVPVSLPCRSIFSDLVILWDGRATSCCFDADADKDLCVGDANSENLLTIWNSDRFNEIRKLHLDGKRAEIPICKRCTFA